MVHLLNEIRLCELFGIHTDEKLPANNEFSDNLKEASDEYVNYIMDLVFEIRKRCKDPVNLIEQKVDFSNFVPDGFGTCDALIIEDRVMHVIDYKNGAGVKVSSEKNLQMMLYSLGALNLFSCLYDTPKISMTIFQPRIGNISTYEMNMDELLDWVKNFLDARAKLAFEGKGEFISGERCKFCKVRFSSVRLEHLKTSN